MNLSTGVLKLVFSKRIVSYWRLDHILVPNLKTSYWSRSTEEEKVDFMVKMIVF